MLNLPRRKLRPILLALFLGAILVIYIYRSPLFRQYFDGSSSLRRHSELQDFLPSPHYRPHIEADKVSPDAGLVNLSITDAEFSFRRNAHFVPSQCPSSLQKKLTSNKWTAKLFHPEIGQLLTSTNITQVEFERLSKYWMPFGFKYHTKFSYHEVMQVLSRIPQAASIFDHTGNSSRPECISCAVVGNGGILNGSRLGVEIDGHDMVFRVNHCIRRGFEEDVGSRTTHLILMDRSFMHTQAEDIPRDKGLKYIFLPCRKQDFDYILGVIASSSSKGNKLHAKPSDVRILHPDFTRYVHKVWEKTRSFRPTTGGMMLFTALHSGCDRLSVYGMGFTTAYSEHYYDNSYVKYHNVRGSHDFQREIDIMKRLDKDGIIRWYKRDVREFLDGG